MDLETVPDANYQTVVSNKQDNILQFEMLAAPTADTAGLQGSNLWELVVWGSDNPIGEGPHHGETSSFNLNSYQRNVPVTPGGVVEFGTVETTFDMRGLTCDNVRYICAQLRRDENSVPSFQLTGVPHDRVLTQCFNVRCSGKCSLHVWMLICL